MVCFEADEIIEMLSVIDKELEKCGFDEVLMYVKKKLTRALYDSEE